MLSEPLQPRLAKDVLRYYLTHPTAVDTCEGLARWRLLEEYVERTTRETEEALAWLVGHGFLDEITRPGGRTVFYMRPDRRFEAERFVESERPEIHGDR
jgi:hypothetical protein